MLLLNPGNGVTVNIVQAIFTFQYASIKPNDLDDDIYNFFKDLHFNMLLLNLGNGLLTS